MLKTFRDYSIRTHASLRAFWGDRGKMTKIIVNKNVLRFIDTSIQKVARLHLV